MDGNNDEMNGSPSDDPFEVTNSQKLNEGGVPYATFVNGVFPSFRTAPGTFRHFMNAPFINPQRNEEYFSQPTFRTQFSPTSSIHRQCPTEKKEGKGKQPKDTTTSAQWNKENTSVFIQACVNEVTEGNVNGGCLSNEGYSNVSDTFFHQTGLRYSRIQFKNKWDKLKKEWALWVSTGASTGGGWDATLNTWARTEEWWKGWIQKFPQAAKFQKGPIQHLQEMEILFSGKVAIGQNLSIPSSSVNTSKVADDEGEGEADSQNQRPSIGSTKRTSSTFPVKKRRKDSSVDKEEATIQLVQAINNHFVSRREMHQDFLAKLDNIDNDNTRLDKCIEDLQACGWAPSDPIYNFVYSKLIRDARFQIGFCGLPSIVNKQHWIEFEYNQFMEKRSLD